MQHQEGRITSADELELFYRRWSKEAKPRATLALVHGIGGHSGMFTNVADYFVPHGYAVYGLDLRGHGKSAGQRGHLVSWDDYVADVEALLQRIRAQTPSVPLFLWGHSMGAVIVLEYILREPDAVQGAITTSAPLGEIGIPPLLFIAARLLSRIWPRCQLPREDNLEQSSRDPEVLEVYTQDPLRHSKGTARLGAEFLKAVARTKARASEVNVPLLMLHGGQDSIAAPEGSRLFIEQVGHPDKAYSELPEAYHELHNDYDYHAMLDKVSDWLEKRLEART